MMTRGARLTVGHVSADVPPDVGAQPLSRATPGEKTAIEDRSTPSVRLGRYELGERIGAGGMAEVFRAAMTGPEGFRRELVVKRILPALTARRGFRRMFVNEAKISALLAHPNIVQIFEFGEIDDAYFIAMESVRGMTLREVLTKLRKADQIMPTVAAAEIVREVLVGLEYAHNLRGADGRPLRIIHRDISPTNVMIAENGTVKILDFGIAHAVDFEDVDGAIKGKIAYLAPEQIRPGAIDHRADLFALGCVFHEMLTGRMLFRAKNDLARKKELLALPTLPPSRSNPDVPHSIDRIVLRALERDPEHRYPSAAEMLLDVDNYLANFRSGRSAVRRLMRALSPDPAGHEDLSSSMISRDDTETPSLVTRTSGIGKVPASPPTSAAPAPSVPPTPLASQTVDRAGPAAHTRLSGIGNEERARFTRTKSRRRLGRALLVFAVLVAGCLAVVAGAAGLKQVIARRPWMRPSPPSPSVTQPVNAAQPAGQLPKAVEPAPADLPAAANSRRPPAKSAKRRPDHHTTTR